MANISVVLEKPISDGSKLKFRTPCESTLIEGLEVKTPAKDGVGTVIKKFVFKDAHGAELCGFGNLFVGGVLIEVLLDVTHGVAFIQNADTNSYVESVKSDIQRMEEAQKEFLKAAGESVEECERAAEAIYIGDGDMPEKALIQIDPSGSVIAVDTELDETSDNLIANKPVAREFAAVYSETRRIDETVAEISGNLSERIDNNATTIADNASAIADNASAIESNASAIAGKADAGYGYGEELVLQNVGYDLLMLDDPYEADAVFLDNAMQNWSVGTNKQMYVDFRYSIGAAVITVTKTSLISALVKGVNTGGQTYVRRKENDKWTPWLHENPEMYTDIEYATTEMCNGKTVYAKRIAFGELPTTLSSKSVKHDIDGLDEIVSITGVVVADGGTTIDTATYDLMSCPLIDTVFVAGGYFTIKANNASGKMNATVTLKYTKKG